VPFVAERHLGIQARGPRLWHVRCDPDVLLYEASGMRLVQNAGRRLGNPRLLGRVARCLKRRERLDRAPLRLIR
jgi:hypothetical protein